MRDVFAGRAGQVHRQLQPRDDLGELERRRGPHRVGRASVRIVIYVAAPPAPPVAPPVPPVAPEPPVPPVVVPPVAPEPPVFPLVDEPPSHAASAQAEPRRRKIDVKEGRESRFMGRQRSRTRTG